MLLPGVFCSKLNYLLLPIGTLQEGQREDPWQVSCGRDASQGTGLRDPHHPSRSAIYEEHQILLPQISFETLFRSRSWGHLPGRSASEHPAARMVCYLPGFSPGAKEFLWERGRDQPKAQGISRVLRPHAARPKMLAAKGASPAVADQQKREG